MKKTTLTFAILLVTVSISLYAKEPAIKIISNINSIMQAKKHHIVSNRPAINFFEGALLGNGGLGVVVTTRPDAVVIRFGHNDVWNIRIAEDNKEKIGTFREIFEKVKAIPGALNSLNDVELKD